MVDASTIRWPFSSSSSLETEAGRPHSANTHLPPPSPLPLRGAMSDDEPALPHARPRPVTTMAQMEEDHKTGYRRAVKFAPDYEIFATMMGQSVKVDPRPLPTNVATAQPILLNRQLNQLLYRISEPAINAHLERHATIPLMVVLSGDDTSPDAERLEGLYAEAYYSLLYWCGFAWKRDFFPLAEADVDRDTVAALRKWVFAAMQALRRYQRLYKDPIRRVPYHPYFLQDESAIIGSLRADPRDFHPEEQPESSPVVSGAFSPAVSLADSDSRADGNDGPARRRAKKVLVESCVVI